MCYCPTPLKHERATVLDLHFEDIVTEPIDSRAQYDGQTFMEYLRALASSIRTERSRQLPYRQYHSLVPVLRSTKRQ